MNPPRIGISLGDPGGIGPEICLRALSRAGGLPQAQYILFGSRSIIENEAKTLGLSLSLHPWRTGGATDGPGVYLHDLPGANDLIKKGSAEASNGRFSFGWFEEAVAAARRGEIEAVVTAPISKMSWNLAGIPWRGHTEYLEQFFPDAVMSFWSDRLTVALLSHHLPLREALARVTPEALARLFRVLNENATRRVARGSFEILVAGLNPHAGEGGLLGTEETGIIGPAIDRARREGLPVSGPFPPDIVFRKALGHPERIVAALYHDQGLIPFKLTAFETGVNVTLGLPFVRTSPDHGTAFDIAGKTPADPSSMIESILLAVSLIPSKIP